MSNLSVHTPTSTEITTSPPAMRAHHPLDGLYPHQLEAYPAFKAWFEGYETMGYLAGVAGSGKTFSIIQWCRALGIPDSRILGVAPTNVASKQLASSTGLNCQTFHKAFDLVPAKSKWGVADDEAYTEATARLASLQTLLTEEATETDETEREIEDCYKLLAVYDRQRAATKNDELRFVLGGESAIDPKDISLIILDECSMLSAENFETVAAYLPQGIKCLFMGDTFQLYPVNEKLSPSFTTFPVARFDTVVRAGEGSEIAKVCNTLREMRSWDDVCFYLQTLRDSDDPLNEPIGSAVVIDRKASKTLAHDWAKNLVSDGTAYRFISYRRATVSSRSEYINRVRNNPNFSEGDLLIANSVVSRTVMLKTSCDGEADFKNYYPLLHNGYSCELGEFSAIQNCTVEIPTGLQEFTVYTYDFIFEGETDKRVYGVKVPGNRYDKKATWSHDLYNLRLLPPAQVNTYKECLKFWSDCRSCFYGKDNKPTNAAKAQAYLEFMGLTKWNQIQGVPGHPYKGDAEPFVVPRDSKATTQFQYLREQVTKRYYWLNSLVDDVIYPMASTVYKAQGSTIERVCFDLKDMIHMDKFADKDNLIRAAYTACSRASKLLYIYL